MRSLTRNWRSLSKFDICIFSTYYFPVSVVTTNLTRIEGLPFRVRRFRSLVLNSNLIRILQQYYITSLNIFHLLQPLNFELQWGTVFSSLSWLVLFGYILDSSPSLPWIDISRWKLDQGRRGWRSSLLGANGAGSVGLFRMSIERGLLVTIATNSWIVCITMKCPVSLDVAKVCHS